ncbi:MAG: prephenate dehydratase [Synechococcales cyanobacterium RM1_1_8]|nr:prephenate dehydratase [Synechococcales cyanobacterium RM1_1_8]
MAISIAHLGPAGTYAEMAAMVFAQAGYLDPAPPPSDPPLYLPCPTIAQALLRVAEDQADWAVVPVENSVEGSVPMTLDTVWHHPELQIHQAMVLPIDHAFLSHGPDFDGIEAVYSHPQALAQCQGWLDAHMPEVERVAVNSTAQAVQLLAGEPKRGAIASLRAAKLYAVPVLDYPINDQAGNCTRFWAVSCQPAPGGSQTSIAFSVHQGTSPGVLVQALQRFAQSGISMSRIESRPTKLIMGDYRFFVDLEGNAKHEPLQGVLADLQRHSSSYQLLGSYETLNLDSAALAQLLKFPFGGC